ncbi:DUF2917 domain-containing protein [Ferribacterium limneticum]|uniref:DUF2917 domain-containing protein n=1 Tax=Ferribacterium limneticum TaxID=76259 RepID=UPI001CF9CE52|nr:DUF2917 domain-containing protein [Ferribacterium limneticum]UCV17506.1 DUF2917 domain-containing protein [Ferribacterium limneticum]
MNSHRVSEEICLQPGHPVRLNDAAGTRVRCLHGTIWITVANEPDDVFLASGQSYLISRNGLSLVERIDNSSIQLERRQAGGWLSGLIRHLKFGPGR